MQDQDLDPDLEEVGRDFDIAVPWTGVDAVESANRKAKWKARLNNHLEIDKNLCRYSSAKHGFEIKPENIMRIDLANLEDANAIYTGTPCYPWSKNSRNLGWKHPDSKHFLKAIKM